MPDNIPEWLTTLVTSLLGSAAAVTFYFKFISDRMLESHKSKLAKEVERLRGEISYDLETHKIRLRKSEILFERELDAVSDFIRLRHDIDPGFSHPDMDAYEAQQEIALLFGEHETNLNKFMSKHRAMIPESAASLIDECIFIAAANKFEATVDGAEVYVSQEANKAAGIFYKKLREAERKLLDSIKEQALIDQRDGNSIENKRKGL